MSEEKETGPNFSTQTYCETVGVGLWGLVITSLLKEGMSSAVASIDAVQAGKAFVETTVLFTKSGISLEGQFCSHGEKAHLFSAVMKNPPSFMEGARADGKG